MSEAAVQACFDLVGYERLLDYTAPPPPPALASEAAAWVDAVLHAAGTAERGMGKQQQLPWPR